MMVDRRSFIFQNFKDPGLQGGWEFRNLGFRVVGIRA